MKTFFSKILLFGEYGIIKDAMGLSIPYSFYKGNLDFSKSELNKNIESNKNLSEFMNYLKKDIYFNEILDLHRLEKDIKNGISFNSNIPIGYGVGSSGALVASIYDNYSINKINSEDIKKEEIFLLKDILKRMEDFFHGESSGIDPLICYLRIPILIDSNKDIKTIDIPKNSNSNTAIFLLDSEISRKTEDFVPIFFEKLKLDKFKHIFNKFIEYNNDSIKSFLRGDIHNMLHNIKELSAIVLANFSPMIPKEFEEIWRKGLEENLYYLKLCGAGGGGFFIGFTENIKKTKKTLKGYKIEVIQNI